MIAVKSTEGFLGFYDLDSLALIKKITVTRIGAQDEGCLLYTSSPHLHAMFVTPKDVDETIKYLSFTISEGLNMAFCS